jgi:hypothetical protein
MYVIAWCNDRLEDLNDRNKCYAWYRMMKYMKRDFLKSNIKGKKRQEVSLWHIFQCLSIWKTKK